MRPLEIALTLGNLVAFCFLLLPRCECTRRAHFASWVALPLAATHVFVEGARWQMVPAYLFALVSSAAILGRRTLPPKKARRSLATRVAIVGCASAVTLLFVISILLPVLLPVFHLAAPAGRYKIGTVTYDWIDTSRRELFSPNAADRRRLVAQVWYPAGADRSPARAPYVDDAAAMSAGLTRALASAGLLRLPSFIFDHFRRVRTHAIPSAAVATDGVTFPVLIYATGLDGFRQASMFQIEELASHGYVVVGLDQPYTAAAVVFSDGKIIEGLPKTAAQPLIDQSISPAIEVPKWKGRALPDGIVPYLAEDVSFTLDELAALNASDPRGILTGHLDLQHVGIFGVSLGAMIAGEACLQDPRLDACLMMDAAMPADVARTGLQQAAMWLTRRASDMRLERARSGGWTEKDIQQTLSSMQAAYAKSKSGNSYYVSIHGMFHVNFTDAPSWSPFAKELGLTGPIGGQRGFAIVNAYSLAFFDRSLRGRPSLLLSGRAERYPEVVVSVRARM